MKFSVRTVPIPLQKGGWHTGPLTSVQLVTDLEECFEFLGGMPSELVFDQDRLLAVNENYDSIYKK